MTKDIVPIKEELQSEDISFESSPIICTKGTPIFPQPSRSVTAITSLVPSVPSIHYVISKNKGKQ